MDGEQEFQKLGWELGNVLYVATEEGSSGAVVVFDGAVGLMEHDAERAAAITSYLRSKGVPVFGYEDEIPEHIAPVYRDAIVEQI